MTGDGVADPAIHAAVTAMLSVTEPTVRATAIAAAREALAPLRDIHRPFDRPIHYGSNETTRVCNHCLGPVEWPCLTALYVYREDEL